MLDKVQEEKQYSMPQESGDTGTGTQDTRELVFFFLFVCFLPFLGPLPWQYGGSQARGPVGAVATGLHQSHSNAGSEPRLRPTPQLTAAPDP